MAHTDLVAVVDEGAPWHGKNEGEGHLHLVGVKVAAQALHVVVARRDAHEALAVSELHVAAVGCHELARVAFAFTAEERVRLLRTVLGAPEEIHVVRRTELQQEVHMETRADGLVGLAPLRDHHRLGVALVQEGAHILPEGDRGLLAGVVLNERAGHVDAEAVAAAIEPERHDVLHGLTGGKRLGAVDRALPRFSDLSKAVVERRLEGKEVHRHGAVALGDAGPHVAAGELVLLGLAGRLEPRMFNGGVPRHKVEKDVHVAGVCLGKEALKILVGAVARRHLAVVRHVVAGIAKGRRKARVEPQRIAAQLAHVVELLDNTGDIADAVGVGVVEALRIDLVKHRVVKPAAHKRSFVAGGT